MDYQREVAGGVREPRPLNLMIGFRLKTYVVIAGQPGMIGGEGNIVYGVCGEPKHVKKIIEKLTSEITKRSKRGTIRSYVDNIVLYIDKELKLDRTEAVTVLIGGYDLDLPQKACLYRINKAGSVWVGRAICAGRGSWYADMIVLDKKKYTRRMNFSEVVSVSQEGFKYAKKYEQSPRESFDINSVDVVSATLPPLKKKLKRTPRIL